MITEHLFTAREEDFVHASFDQEIAFYESICSGNIELVRMLATPLCSEGYGMRCGISSTIWRSPQR